MAKLPQSITIQLLCSPGEGYRAHMTGWALDESGVYGSRWCLDINDVAPRDSNAAGALEGLAAALVRRIAGQSPTG